MNKKEFDRVMQQEPVPRVFGIKDLKDKTPRTLLYGYYSDGPVKHVYIGKDNLIHVLDYEVNTRTNNADSPDVPKFNIIKHTCGETGGVAYNSGYSHAKRMYPESCDFEFCMLLAKDGAAPTFTSFDEKSGEARNQYAQNGYAGFTMEDGGLELVSVDEQVVQSISPLFPDLANVEKLARRLVVEACRSSTAANWSSEANDGVLVDAKKADEIVRRATVLASTIPHDLISDAGLRKKLLEKVFGASQSIETGVEYTSGGEYCVTFQGAPLQFSSAKGIQPYVLKKGESEFPIAATSAYKGHRFIVIVYGTDGSGVIRFCQFGDSTRVLRALEHNFEPKAKTAA